MADFAADKDKGDVSPDMRELVASVQARARGAPTEGEIQMLAARAAHRARGDTHTIQEINHLAGVALADIEQISRLMNRLAELTNGSPP